MTRRSTQVTALLCGAIAATPAVAHAEIEIGLTGGVHFFSKSNELGVDDVPDAPSAKNSALIGLRVGVFFTHWLGIEGEFGVLPTKVRDLDYSVTAITYRAHLIFQARAKDPNHVVIPFVLLGGGGFSALSTDSSFAGIPNKDLYEDTDGALYAGIGAKFRLGRHWGLRVDGRALMVPSSNNDTPPSEDVHKVTADFEALASIYLSLGGAKHTEAAPPPPPVDDDPDKDGIRGAADQCPNDPEDKDGYQDDDGCSDPDNDNDGILDTNDKCPNEAEDKDGFQDEDGCPDPDNDGDGVLDANDKCPAEAETKNGYQDEDGCPDQLPAKVKAFSGVVQGINFRSGSADLLATSNRTLDKAVAVLKEFPELKMEIQGHTDDVALKPKKGSKFADNLELSQARAESVREYFIKKGITEDRLSAKGYGDSAPVVDPTGLKGGKLTAARSKNRRVEFKLISPLEAGAATK